MVGITGYKGRLGSELLKYGYIPIDCDITDLTSLEVSGINDCDVVINCAAYTDVDGAEGEDGKDEAYSVNFRGVDNLRRIFRGRLIHISTDYVFDGTDGPYDEMRDWEVGVNNYGASKLGGEIALLTPYREGDMIVRTTGLYGSKKHDFFQLVMNTLTMEKQLLVTKELEGNQTYVPHLAEALSVIVDKEFAFPVIHVGSKEVVSRYAFAQMIAEEFGLDQELLIPVGNDDIPGWIADRPKDAGLKVYRAERRGIPIYSIRDGLKDMRK